MFERTKNYRIDRFDRSIDRIYRSTATLMSEHDVGFLSQCLGPILKLADLSELHDNQFKSTLMQAASNWQGARNEILNSTWQ